MIDYFPFHELGFRCNPFRRPTAEEWAELAVVPDDVLAAVRGGGHVQVVGDAGTGKSTCLRGLTARLAGEGQRSGYEYLALGQRRFRTALSGLDAFLLDEAQRLTRRERSRLLAEVADGPGGPLLVLGVHEDLSPVFARYRLPLLTVYLDRASPTHVAAVLSRRLAYFALDDPPAIVFSADAVRHLCDVSGGNLRQIEGFLYEFFQSLPQPGSLTAEMLAEFSPPIRPTGAERPPSAPYA